MRTPTTVRIIAVINAAGFPVLVMFTGANAQRGPLNRYLINVRALYYQETGAMVKHMIEDVKTINVVLHQYGAYGFEGLKGTERALKKYGQVPVPTGT